MARSVRFRESPLGQTTGRIARTGPRWPGRRRRSIDRPTA